MAPTMNNTSTHRPVLLLILIMTAVAVGVGGIAGYALYATAFEQQRERLVELADSQAHLIQAVTRIEAQYGLDDYPGGAFAAPLSQIIEAHEKFQSFGQSGEFTLARLEGDQIVFLLSHRYGGLANPEPVPLDSQNAEPMRRALRGGTGTLIGLDYRGERVLAAYHLLQDLGLGIVAKIDLAEVRGPFIRTGILAGSASLLLISLGSVLFLRIGNPMVQRLKESERKYRTLVEQIPTVTYTALPDDVSTTLYISPQIEELLGFTPTEWVKDPDLFVRQLHPEDRARVMDGIAESRKRGDAFNSEFRMLARDGRALWFRDEARMMRDEAGRPLFLQGVMLDITDRKRRQDSEEKFSAVVQSARDAIVLADDNGRIMSWNAAAGVIFGYSEQEVLGRPLSVLMPERYRDVHRRAVDRHRQSGDATVVGTTRELAGLRKDGTEFPLELSLATFQNEGRRFYSAFIRDTTDRKRSEEDLERLVKAVDQVGEGIVITDSNGAVQYVNPAFERITGYTTKEIIGQNAPFLKSDLHGEDSYKEFWGTISRGEAWKGRLTNKRKDGALYEEDMTVSPVFDSAGQIRNYIAVKRDVTQQVSLERQFRQAQKMEAVGQLAGGVAHDFNNLLTGITGYSELALATLPPQGQPAADVAKVIELAGRASDLTRRLLMFARRQPYQPQVVNLNELMQNVSKMLRRLIGEDIEMELVAAPDVGNVRADPGQIEQVLMNLAVNSRDAMPEGGKLTIELTNVSLDADLARQRPGVTPGPHVMLSVTDTGQGMDEATRQRVFEPFFTTKERGKGTGLGLAMVHGIVKQHGGSIFVYSEPGKGTCFKIYLPRVDEETEAPAVIEDREPVSRGSETILVVEDEEEVRAVIERELEEHGYRVLTAAGPEEAEELYASHEGEVSLLLTDVVMPGYDGKRLYQRLAEKTPSLKVLFMSGYAERALERSELLAMGASLLQKPFSPAQLVRELQKVLEGKEADHGQPRRHSPREDRSAQDPLTSRLGGGEAKSDDGHHRRHRQAL